MKIKLPRSTYNWISLIGATIALISFAMIVFLFVVSVLIEEGRPYLGIVIYMVLPACLIIGLLLIPMGMFIKVMKGKELKDRGEKWPLINLNDIRQRTAFLIFSIGTVIFLFASAIGSYEAFHFTESNQFCGEICHSVMNPEYNAYKHSSHARVKCVECHVGEGADWYAKSKLSGLYQVYAVTTNIFPRPIPTPITNLRPARETCEKCHWPEKFYARKLRVEKHFLTDEENTEWDINLLMKIGSTYGALGLQEGIHWHINPSVKIEYISNSEKRETIPWIRYTNKETGEESVYEDLDDPLDETMIDSLEVRVMDCMDCHNRPSHNYRPPAFFVNNALTAGTISQELPEIKALAMEICGEEFTTTDSAMQYIDNTINEFYEDNYPDIFEEQSELINKAVKGLQTEFKKNIYPEMKVRWDAYPNHIGHVEFNGCFRCHDDNHANGKESLCTDCHTGLDP
jgi:hypothetical protein